MSANIRGLSLDGGGVFGVGAAAILEQMRDPFKFQFVAGTSIGAILAAAVAVHDEAKMREIVSIFRKWMPRVFGGYGWWSSVSGAIATPKHSDVELARMLQDIFGQTTLGEVEIPVFITAADMQRETLKVYESADDDDAEVPIWEVLRAAVAAQTFFSAWRGMADGGIFANNPAMVAIVGALDTLKHPLASIKLLSIGTGAQAENTNDDTDGWSLVRWAPKLIRMQLRGGSSKMHERFARAVLGKRLQRIQFKPAPLEWDMDDPAVLEKLLELWHDDIEKGVVVADAF